MRSKGRAVLHSEVLPEVARCCLNGDKVVEIGTHRFWDYEPYFVNPGLICEYCKTDLVEVIDQITGLPKGNIIDDITNSAFEADSLDVVLFIGMHDNISDPQKAYEEIYRILKPGGQVVVAFPGEGAKCGGRLSDCDDWKRWVPDFLVDKVWYVYGPENEQRYSDGECTSIICLLRKPYEPR